MSRVLNSISTIATGAVVIGIVKDFFIYDGEILSHKLNYHYFIIFILLLFIVDAGTRAVIFDKFKGIQAVSVGEGTHFKIPFIQEPKIIDVRSRPRVIHSSTGTKDLQMVKYYPTYMPSLILL